MSASRSRSSSTPSLADSITVTVVRTSTSVWLPPSTPLPPPLTSSVAVIPSPSLPTSNPSLDTLPPPYSAPPQSTPLSFYPTFPPASSQIDALPRYRVVPRTIAERCFFWGLLFFPLFIVGISKIWRPESITGKGKHASAVSGEENNVGMENQIPTEWSSGNVNESIALWREEELVWAKRCAYALIILISVVGMVAVVGYSMFGKR